jgi:hypothetical protein
MTNFKSCLYDNDWGQFIDTDPDPDLIPSKITPNKIVLKTIQECQEEEEKEKEKEKEKEEEKEKGKDNKFNKKKLFKEKYNDYCNIPDTIIYFRTY